MPYYHPSEADKESVKVSVGIDSRLWTILEINAVHAPKTWDLTSGWEYRPCLAGGLYKKGKAVLIPSHKGLKLALEDFAESIYPNATCDSGRVASDILQATRNRILSKDELTVVRTLTPTDRNQGDYIRCRIAPVIQPMYMMEVQVSSHTAHGTVDLPPSIAYHSTFHPMTINGTPHIGSQTSSIGLVGELTGVPNASDLDTLIATIRDWQPTLNEEDETSASLRLCIKVDRATGSSSPEIAYDTVTCKVFEPSEVEMELMPTL